MYSSALGWERGEGLVIPHNLFILMEHMMKRADIVEPLARFMRKIVEEEGAKEISAVKSALAGEGCGDQRSC